MHRVLQSLHELLELCDSRLERPKAILPTIDAPRFFRLVAPRLFRLVGRVSPAANLADPRDQPLKLAHDSPSARTLGRLRAARIPSTLFLGHLANHQRAALDLLAHQLELRLALLLGFLPCALHLVTSPGRRIETVRFGQP